MEATKEAIERGALAWFNCVRRQNGMKPSRHIPAADLHLWHERMRAALTAALPLCERGRVTDVDHQSLWERLEKAEWVLHNSGFRRCDIPACNCGSWHQVGGYRLRFDEIKDVVEDAGYSTNGRTLLDAVKAMARDLAASPAPASADAGATKEVTPLQDFKSRLDIRLNNYLCGMHPEYDDSITGFNEAWDIMRKLFNEISPAECEGVSETKATPKD